MAVCVCQIANIKLTIRFAISATGELLVESYICWQVEPNTGSKVLPFGYLVITLTEVSVNVWEVGALALGKGHGAVHDIGVVKVVEHSSLITDPDSMVASQRYLLHQGCGPPLELWSQAH